MRIAGENAGLQVEKQRVYKHTNGHGIHGRTLKYKIKNFSVFFRGFRGHIPG